MLRPVTKKDINQFWSFDQREKETLARKLACELPTLRAKVGVSQDDIAKATGISRQTYGAYEKGDRPIPWSMFLALLFYFDYIPSTHRLIRTLELFPSEFDECWLAATILENEENHE